MLAAAAPLAYAYTVRPNVSSHVVGMSPHVMSASSSAMAVVRENEDVYNAVMGHEQAIHVL